MPHSPKLPSWGPAFDTNTVGSSPCCCHTICPPKRHAGSRAHFALPADWGAPYPALCCSLLILPFIWQLVGCRRFHFQNRELQCAKKLIYFFKGKLLNFPTTSTKFWCQQGDNLLQVFPSMSSLAALVTASWVSTVSSHNSICSTWAAPVTESPISFLVPEIALLDGGSSWDWFIKKFQQSSNWYLC